MEESISYVSDLGVAELPATVGSAMQPEPCCGRVLGDNGCSIDTKNYTSCPTHDDDDDNWYKKSKVLCVNFLEM